MADRKALLAYAGALPFIGGAILVVAGVQSFGPLPPAAITAAWALTIASFMAGVHWGQYLANGERIGINLFLASNVIAIAGWVAFLTLPVRGSLVAFAALFAALLLIDARLHKDRQIEPDYWALRYRVSLIVIASLILTAAYA